ncbi:MAG: hypothetical protein HYZ85_01725 [Candidatus Omnitrophica bacterium]|nr:hypothetical protein [Candidatus Omnitrophota bacterium]
MKSFLKVFYKFLFFFILFPHFLPAEIEKGLSDEALLDLIQRRSFRYFEIEKNPKSGLVYDRAHNFKSGALRAPASIAATGFALTAYGVAVHRNWMDRASAQEITRRTLETFLTQVDQEHGFFYHFLDPVTAKRVNHSELSPIDTALFLAGVLFAAEFYEDPPIRDLAMEIYERVDWPWMLSGGETFRLAWSPENGFDRNRWDHYNESLILYLLAIGSPTHPIPASSWKVLRRPVGSYRNYRLIQSPPLFTHQYSHIWIDFHGKNDGFADYFQNSVQASLANRAFAIDQSANFQSYGPNSWGFTASDAPFGYKAYGAPPGWAEHDGTIAPTGCGSSIVFTPKESVECLRHFYENLGDRLWGEYGFSDAFNLDRDWFAPEVIGIDQGALLSMIENHRSALIWETMTRNTFLQSAMKKVGFVAGPKELPWPEPPHYEVPYMLGGPEIDGYLKEWPSAYPVIILDKNQIEGGEVKDDQDLKGEIRFAWDEEALYFSVKVTDDSLNLKKTGKNIWQDDCIEIFVDPAGDGLFWYDESDFQIGFRPEANSEEVLAWSWFQGGMDPASKSLVRAHGFTYENGYILEAAIRWKMLGLKPVAGSEFRLSAALHDLDKDRSQAKLQWFFRNEEAWKRFVLGKLRLKGGEGIHGHETQKEDLKISQEDF